MTRLVHQTLIVATFILLFSLSSNAQSVEDRYQELTTEWLEVSEKLKSYNGLAMFCESPEFREQSIKILSHLHHFDSVVIDFLNESTTVMLIGEKEYTKTLKDINNFEDKYSNKAFLDFLRESCVTRNDLERNKEDLKGEMGINSFDGQVLVLESGLNKYLKHIDKRIVAIEKHMHMIHPDRIGIQLARNDTF